MADAYDLYEQRLKDSPKFAQLIVRQVHDEWGGFTSADDWDRKLSEIIRLVTIGLEEVTPDLYNELVELFGFDPNA
jgi:hypothetical protein